jgi:hypothetical protein
MGHDLCFWCKKPESMNVVAVGQGQYLLCDRCLKEISPEVIKIVADAIRVVAELKKKKKK